MEKMVLMIFEKEIERQCKFALIAKEQINIGLKNNIDLFWYAIQNFLVATGNISKIFWPSEQKYEERGVELRQILGIKEDSPLKSRTFRNHFEHFDDRLEKWARSSQRKNFADSNIGPSNMISGLDEGDYMRNFDTTSWALTFRGDKCKLKPIIKAIEDLYPKIIMRQTNYLGDNNLI